MQGAISAVADCRTPTIASVHGWCIGGGVDLISAVDIRYASADAKFSVREVKLAIVADVGSLARLPLILTDGHLRELALTGKDIDAARAEKIGLVNDVYDDAEASLAAAHETAAEIAANPPLAVNGVKDVLDQQRIARVSESLRYVAAWNAAILPSKDLTEGITATFEKRAPNFTGNRRPAEFGLGLGVGQRQPGRSERRRRVGRDQAHQPTWNRYRRRPVQFLGQLARVVAERLRPVVDDVVDLPAAAVGRRHRPWPSRHRRCAPTTQCRCRSWRATPTTSPAG